MTGAGADVASIRDYLVTRLRETEGRLPDELRARVLAHGAALVPDLLEIVRHPDLHGVCEAPDGPPRGGWPLLHAVSLLGELEVAEAVEPLLDIMDRTQYGNDTVHAWITLDLPRIGAPVLEPALARLAACEDADRRESYTFMLAGVRVPDARVWEMICNVFAEDQVEGAILFSRHGDRRAIPLLEAALRKIQAKGYCNEVHFVLAELLTSYDDVGGTLPDDLAQYVKDAYAEMHRREGPFNRTPAPAG